MKMQALVWRAGAPLLGCAVVLLAYRAYGWQGVAAAAAGLVMWLLLHFTRMMNTLKKAANRPLGFVASAVMLNARLDQGILERRRHACWYQITAARSAGVTLPPGSGSPSNSPKICSPARIAPQAPSPVMPPRRKA